MYVCVNLVLLFFYFRGLCQEGLLRLSPASIRRLFILTRVISVLLFQFVCHVLQINLIWFDLKFCIVCYSWQTVPWLKLRCQFVTTVTTLLKPGSQIQVFYATMLSICLFVRKPVKFVKSFARWQHRGVAGASCIVSDTLVTTDNISLPMHLLQTG